jgi:hypothetical protein
MPEVSIFGVVVGELGLEGCGASAILLIDLAGAGRDAVVEGGSAWLADRPAVPSKGIGREGTEGSAHR